MLNEKDLEYLLKEKRGKKGQSMVEFAVSLVILLIILSGVVDLGRLFFYYIAMRDAAQEGVVYGIVNPNHCSQIIDRTVGVLSDDSRISVDITVNGEACEDAEAADACAGKTLEVSVTDPAFPITMPFLGTFLGRNTLEVNASVSGTILRPPCP